MIAASVSSSLTSDALPINWFDAAVLVLIGFGVFRGRKNGMTRELGPTIQWLLVVFGAGLGYPYLAQIYNTQCHLDKLLSALAAYASIAVVIFMIFIPIKKVLKG